MRIAALVRNEALKTTRRRAFVVTWLLCAGVTAVVVVGLLSATAAGPEQSAQLPGAWSATVGVVGALTGFFAPVALILLITPEFTWKTARQNVIDGLSKEEFFLGKALLYPVVGITFFATAVVVIGVVGLANTDVAAATGPLVGRDDLVLMARALLGTLGYAGIGFFTAFLARSSGAAMGLFFLYVAILEQVFGAVLSQMGPAMTMVAGHLPKSVFDQLLGITQSGIPPGGGGLRAGVAVAWIFVLLAASLVLHRRRDL